MVDMEFKASIDQLHKILEWIAKQLKPMRFDHGMMHHIELASEEALVNIIHHAYQGRPEKVEIQVKLLPDRAEIFFEDCGPPFNPLNSLPIDLSQPLETRVVGGLGIHFMRKCVDDIRYARHGEKNVLTFVIHSSRKK